MLNAPGSTPSSTSSGSVSIWTSVSESPLYESQCGGSWSQINSMIPTCELCGVNGLQDLDEG